MYCAFLVCVSYCPRFAFFLIWYHSVSITHASPSSLSGRSPLVHACQLFCLPMHARGVVATGSSLSGCMNSIMVQILLKRKPGEGYNLNCLVPNSSQETKPLKAWHCLTAPATSSARWMHIYA
jgi:hypothetical protein